MTSAPQRGRTRPRIRSRTSTTFSPREKENQFSCAVAPLTRGVFPLRREEGWPAPQNRGNAKRSACRSEAGCCTQQRNTNKPGKPFRINRCPRKTLDSGVPLGRESAPLLYFLREIPRSAPNDRVPGPLPATWQEGTSADPGGRRKVRRGGSSSDCG